MYALIQLPVQLRQRLLLLPQLVGPKPIRFRGFLNLGSVLHRLLATIAAVGLRVVLFDVGRLVLAIVVAVFFLQCLAIALFHPIVLVPVSEQLPVPAFVFLVLFLSVRVVLAQFHVVCLAGFVEIVCSLPQRKLSLPRFLLHLGRLVDDLAQPSRLLNLYRGQ